MSAGWKRYGLLILILLLSLSILVTAAGDPDQSWPVVDGATTQSLRQPVPVIVLSRGDLAAGFLTFVGVLIPLFIYYSNRRDKKDGRIFFRLERLDRAVARILGHLGIDDPED